MFSEQGEATACRWPDAKDDMDVFSSAQAGFAWMIDHFEFFDRPVEEHGWTDLDVSHHSLALQPDIHDSQYVYV